MLDMRGECTQHQRVRGLRQCVLSSLHPALEVHLDHSPFLMSLQITQLVKVFSLFIYVHVFLLMHPIRINCFTLASPEDYLSASGILIFNTGDTRQCHNIEIVNDAECEAGVEQLILNLTLVTGAPVTVDPPSAQVIISDDRGDCGK